MKQNFARSTIILLALSMSAAVGGGLYETFVLTPLWSSAPPQSFSVIQPDTGVPLQNFWIPVHAAITVFFILAIVLSWREAKTRRLLLIALGSYIVMRVWSALFFIPEMLQFQQVSLDSAPTAELLDSVASWTFWTYFREPLDILTFVCILLALFSMNRFDDKTTEGPRVSASGED